MPEMGGLVTFVTFMQGGRQTQNDVCCSMLKLARIAVPQFGEDRESNLGIVEGNGAVGEDLLLFVPFAGDEDYVTGFGCLKGEANGRGAVDLDGVIDAG